MKRDEKNSLSRKKIMDSAFAEFAAQGYERGSVNAICASGSISKGILYHYFRDKDELYLLCVKDLFDRLTAHLSAALADGAGDAQARLEQYFAARLDFFHENPLCHSLFCDAVIGPPQHLAQAISAVKADFDSLNVASLRDLLRGVRLREGITVDAAVETFRLYQDFINARGQMDSNGPLDLEDHERACKRSLAILLYGIVEKGA